MLARVGAAEGLAVLVFAVDGFHHQLAQLAAGVARHERIPGNAPDGLAHGPAGPTQIAIKHLDDFAAATPRPIQARYVAVGERTQVSPALTASATKTPITP